MSKQTHVERIEELISGAVGKKFLVGDRWLTREEYAAWLRAEYPGRAEETPEGGEAMSVCQKEHCEQEFAALESEVARLREEGRKMLAAAMQASILYDKERQRADRLAVELREVLPMVEHCHCDGCYYGSACDGEVLLHNCAVCIRLREIRELSRAALAEAAPTRCDCAEPSFHDGCEHRQVKSDAAPNHPCAKCGKPRTKAEGGTTFTVCDDCWDAGQTPEGEPAPDEQDFRDFLKGE
jgi:hypothetical protein